MFAIFLLSASRAYARTKETGRASVISTDAALTKAPHWEAQWLVPSVSKKHITAFSSSPRQEARSLPTWNFQSHPITTLSKLSLPTKPHSLSILNPASKSPLSLSVGSLENITRLNAGDLFTASNNFSNINTEPAERRVLFAVQSPQVDNVTMQKWQVQVTILGASICAVVSALIQGAPRWILVAVAIVLAAWALFLSIKRPTYESHSETAKNEPTHPLKAIVPVKESEVSAGVHPVPERNP
jgi:hypothetical protein